MVAFAVLCALVALVALGGWAATLIGFARSMPAQATALKVLGEFDARFDSRIIEALNRVRPRKADEPDDRRPPTVLDDAAEVIRERARGQGWTLDMPPMPGESIEVEG